MLGPLTDGAPRLSAASPDLSPDGSVGPTGRATALVVQGWDGCVTYPLHRAVGSEAVDSASTFDAAFDPDGMPAAVRGVERFTFS